MAKPPKFKNLFKDADYIDKLSTEEKDWLAKFELNYKFGIGGTKADEKDANARKYRKKHDVMNVTNETIAKHHSNKVKRSAVHGMDLQDSSNEEENRKNKWNS